MVTPSDIKHAMRPNIGEAKGQIQLCNDMIIHSRGYLSKLNKMFHIITSLSGKFSYIRLDCEQKLNCLLDIAVLV